MCDLLPCHADFVMFSLPKAANFDAEATTTTPHNVLAASQAPLVHKEQSHKQPPPLQLAGTGREMCYSMAGGRVTGCLGRF